MENNYELLRKHFNKETTDEEEEVIRIFRKNNLQEYLVLENLWWSNVDLQIKDFDSHSAWKKVMVQVNKQQNKTKSLYLRLSKVAAIAVLLIVSMFFVYYLTKEKSSTLTSVTITEPDQRGFEISLNDGSKVWLNKNASFSYPDRFTGKKRKVSLKGEAYFEIAKNPERPFIIETDKAEVTVLGTSFNIKSDTSQSIIYVTTGTVKVFSKIQNDLIVLNANEMATATKNRLQKSDIANPNFLSWKTGSFIFKDDSLVTVIHDLNTFYDKKIQLHNHNIEQLFTANFNKAKQEDIIEILKLTYHLTIEEKENSYEIY